MTNTDEMRKVYLEFGINIHELQPSIQQGVNRLVKEIIKLRKRSDRK